MMAASETRVPEGFRGSEGRNKIKIISILMLILVLLAIITRFVIPHIFRYLETPVREVLFTYPLH